MNKIAIIGSGGMGSACGNVLTDNKNNVIIYGINESELNDLKNGKSTFFGDKLAYYKPSHQNYKKNEYFYLK